MRAGSHAYRMLHRLRSSQHHFLFRSELARFSCGSHPDRDVSRLVVNGEIDRVGRGLWFVPTGRRPAFDVPRFWSNPSLDDPDRICALVLSDPTLPDVARAMFAYGHAKMEAAIENLEGRLDPVILGHARGMLSNAWTGLCDAARRKAA